MIEVIDGIEEVTYDKEQPFRVWHDGHIIWFAQTEGEALDKLAEEQAWKACSKVKASFKPNRNTI